MVDLEKEAEEYFKNYDDCQPFVMDIAKDFFIAGANSKWVQAEKIEAKIQGLMLANDNPMGISYRMQELEQQLKNWNHENRNLWVC